MATRRQSGRQERFKAWLNRDDIKGLLLEYAERHGVTAVTKEHRSKEDEADELTTKLWDTYDRVWAHKILEKFRNENLTSVVDGSFITGGTREFVEIKGRCYEPMKTWAWAIDPEKYEELLERRGYLLYLWIPDDGEYMKVHYALWDVVETPPVDVEIECSSSVTKRGRGNKKKKDKAWYIKDAVISGTIEGKIQG